MNNKKNNKNKQTINPFQNTELNQFDYQNWLDIVDALEVIAKQKEDDKIFLGKNIISSSPLLPQYDRKAHNKRLSSNQVKEKRLHKIKGWYLKLAFKEKQKGAFMSDYIENFHPIMKCMSHCLPKVQPGLFITPKTGLAHITGIFHCNNVHGCPWCAARINEKRRQEIELAIKKGYEKGLVPFMLTLTFPHSRTHKLQDLLDKQAKALTLLRSGKFWQSTKEKYGIVGLIRALEVNHSNANGWHPHTHELTFSRPLTKKEGQELQQIILKRWEQCCINAGLIKKRRTLEEKQAFNQHSTDIILNCSASDYLTKAAIVNEEEIAIQVNKWGVDKELAYRSTKEGRKSGRTIWQLIDDDRPDLYFEYMDAMKGKASIYFSPKIKALIEEGQKEEEENKTEEEKELEKPRRIMWFEREEWRLIDTMRVLPKILWFGELPLPREDIEKKVKKYLGRLKVLEIKQSQKREREKACLTD